MGTKKRSIVNRYAEITATHQTRLAPTDRDRRYSLGYFDGRQAGTGLTLIFLMALTQQRLRHMVPGPGAVDQGVDTRAEHLVELLLIQGR